MRFIVFAFFLIVAFTACEEQSNPVLEDEPDETQTYDWALKSKIDGVQYPNILFINSNEGFVWGYTSPPNNTVSKTSRVFGEYFANGMKYTVHTDSTNDLDPQLVKTPFYKTHNAGQSWIQVNIPLMLEIEDICFIGEKNGYLLGSHGIFKTSDGGNNWRLVFGYFISTQTRNGNSSSTSIGVVKNIAFYDELHGVATTIGVTDNPVIFTDDGGKTWEFDFPDMFNPKIYFPEHGVNVGYASNWSGIHKTSDGGHTWEMLSFSDSSPAVIMSFVNSNELVIYNDRALYKTVDGGKSFAMFCDFSENYGWGDYADKIAYLSSGEFYFITGGSIGFYSDSSKTFEKTNAPQRVYYDFSFRDKYNGYAITSDGQFFVYNKKN